MILRKYIFFGLVASLVAIAARGDEFTYNVDKTIPDNSASGLQDTQSISGMLGPISSVEVKLNILTLDGDLAWNGDFYVSLQHGSGFSVLLNRTGKTSANPLGYSDNGFDITFAASGTDIHGYQDYSPIYDGDGLLTGTWGVDGRNVDPDDVLDIHSRDAMLSSFQGLDANGDWTLFVADMSSGGNAKLNTWGLDIEAVPEPMSMAFISLFGIMMLVARRFV